MKRVLQSILQTVFGGFKGLVIVWQMRRQVELLEAEPGAPIAEPGPMLLALSDRAGILRAPFLAVERENAGWLATHANWTAEQREAIVRKLAGAILEACETRTTARLASDWFLRALGLGILVALIASAGNLQNFFMEQMPVCTIIAASAALVTFPLYVMYYALITRCLAPAIEALGCIGGSDAVFPLATALLRAPLRTAAAENLPRTIAALTPDDYGALPAETVPALCHALPRATDAIKIDVLHALGMIGDGRALKAVEHIAAGSHSVEVRHAAEEIVPILQQRMEEETASEMLLRAGSAPAQQDNTLLRPAGAVETEPEQLLRAGSGESP